MPSAEEPLAWKCPARRGRTKLATRKKRRDVQREEQKDNRVERNAVHENRGGRPDLFDLPFPAHGATLDRGSSSCKCVRDKLEHEVLSQGRIAEFGSRFCQGNSRNQWSIGL
jgi:hypothetical protein